MRHALIIDDNMAISRGIRQRLEAFGFDSFDYTWSKRQALEAAAVRPPDLVIVGETIAGGSPGEVATQVVSENDAPVIAVTKDGFTLRHSVPQGVAAEGPYTLSQLDRALVSAQMMA